MSEEYSWSGSIVSDWADCFCGSCGRRSAAHCPTHRSGQCCWDIATIFSAVLANAHPSSGALRPLFWVRRMEVLIDRLGAGLTRWRGGEYEQAVPSAVIWQRGLAWNCQPRSVGGSKGRSPWPPGTNIGNLPGCRRRGQPRCGRRPAFRPGRQAVPPGRRPCGEGCCASSYLFCRYSTRIVEQRLARQRTSLGKRSIGRATKEQGYEFPAKGYSHEIARSIACFNKFDGHCRHRPGVQRNPIRAIDLGGPKCGRRKRALQRLRHGRCVRTAVDQRQPWNSPHGRRDCP